MEQIAADHFDLLVQPSSILFVTLMPVESGEHAVEQGIGKAMRLRDNSSVNIWSAVIAMPILPPTHLFLKIISMVYASKTSKTSKQLSV